MRLSQVLACMAAGVPFLWALRRAFTRSSEIWIWVAIACFAGYMIVSGLIIGAIRP